MPLIDNSCRDFIEELAGSAPVPGGGGASALAGAIGTALGNMVGSLTVGKKKYADVEADIFALKQKADVLQAELLVLVEKDAQAFAPLAEAYGMPAETEQQKAEKAEVMEKCLRQASLIPLGIMKKCGEAILLQKEFAEKGSRLAVSDAGTGVAICSAALKGAALNVFINTKAMKDSDFAASREKEAKEILEKYTKLADEIYESVKGSLQRGC